VELYPADYSRLVERCHVFFSCSSLSELLLSHLHDAYANDVNGIGSNLGSGIEPFLKMIGFSG
jgi:hypothetical protein